MLRQILRAHINTLSSLAALGFDMDRIAYKGRSASSMSVEDCGFRHPRWSIWSRTEKATAMSKCAHRMMRWMRKTTYLCDDVGMRS